MAFCNYTDRIYDYECLGDSLHKINQNFTNLNKAVCEEPEIIPGPGISVGFNITEQDQYTATVAAENSFDYGTKFDSYNGGAEQTSIQISDSTHVAVTTFPYNGSESSAKPTVTFTTIAKAKSYPQVTIYWLADGTEPTATLPLNEGVADNNRGITWFNDTVSCTLSAPEGLYVGGSFESVGGNFSQKLALLDVNSTPQGQFLSSPIPFLGQIGEVRDIKTATIQANGIDNELLIIGGTFESIGTKGRGLVILNKTTNITYSWYVNGDVNALEIDGNTLYVGGTFDYINYGSLAATVASGLRFKTNGLVSISLRSVISGLAQSSITDYSTALERNATIYDLVLFNQTLYVGGKFSVTNSANEIVHENLISFDLTPVSVTSVKYVAPGTPISSFKVLVKGPVYTLYIDNTISEGGSAYLYVGGLFSKVYSHSQFYLDPRNKSRLIELCNAFCVELSNLDSIKAIPAIVRNWNPTFAGPVLNFLSDNNSPEGYVYCYGQFGSVNNESASHLCAVGKASSDTLRGKLHPHWKPGIQNGPSIPNKTLLSRTTMLPATTTSEEMMVRSLIVGGNFTKVSKHFRYNLAEVARISDVYENDFMVWDCGGQIVSPGNLFELDLYASTTSRVSSTPFEITQLNSTVFCPFDEGFKELTPGQPIRFFIRRPGLLCDTDDAFKAPVNIVGWKVDFNREGCLGGCAEKPYIENQTPSSPNDPTPTPNPTTVIPPTPTPTPSFGNNWDDSLVWNDSFIWSE